MESEASDRESLDEAVTHVLAASFWAVVGVIAIVIGQSTTHAKGGALVGFSAGVVVFVGMHVALLFLMVIFRLYDSYMFINKVSDRLNGNVLDD